VNVLVRKLSRFLFDARKLRAQMEAEDSKKEYSKAAHTLHELESVLQESKLESIDALRLEVIWIRETGIRVRRQADEDLRNGLRQNNQLALSGALQTFFNLQCLWPQLEKVLVEFHDEFAQGALPTGPSFQQALEINLQLLMAHTHRIFTLDELIRTKTDPVTHRSFSDVLEAEGVESLMSYFWAKATATLRVKIAKVAQDRAARRTVLADLPRVLQAFSEAMDRAALTGRSQSFLSTTDRDALFAVVGDLRDEFLAESIRRVTDPVEMMLPNKLLASVSASGGERCSPPGSAGEGSIASELPTLHDLRRYAQLLAAELERCESCPELLLREAVRSVRSSILFFATRLEQLVDSSSLGVCCFENEISLQLRSPLPTPTAGHARNAQLFGLAHHMQVVLKEVMPARFQTVVVTQQVQSTLQQIQATIIQPLLGVIRRAVLASLARMETDLQGDRDDASGSLIATKTVNAHLARYYFSSFGAGQLLPYLKGVSIFIVRAFLSAASIVKPCSGPARAALAQDMSTIESILSTLIDDFQSCIRHEAGLLRDFKQMLFLPSLETVDFESLTNTIPLHLLLTYLVHQLPSHVPTLPVFCNMATQSYLENVLLQLWDEKLEATAAFKTKLAELSDKYNLDPTESAVIAFIMAQTA